MSADHSPNAIKLIVRVDTVAVLEVCQQRFATGFDVNNLMAAQLR